MGGGCGSAAHRRMCRQYAMLLVAAALCPASADHRLAFISPRVPRVTSGGAPAPPPVTPPPQASLTDEELSSLLSGRHALVLAGEDATIAVEVAETLVHVGAHVLLACRSPAACRRRCASANQRCRELRSADSSAGCEVRTLDLTSERELWSFASTLKREDMPLHLIVNCANDAFPFYQRRELGGERCLSVNHVGPFLLTQLLLDQMHLTMRRDALEYGRLKRVAQRRRSELSADEQERLRLLESAGVLPRVHPAPLGRVITLGLQVPRLEQPPASLRCLPFSPFNFTAWGAFCAAHQSNTLASLHLAELLRASRLSGGDFVELNVVHIGSYRWLWKPVRETLGTHRLTTRTIAFLTTTPTKGISGLFFQNGASGAPWRKEQPEIEPLKAAQGVYECARRLVGEPAMKWYDELGYVKRAKKLRTLPRPARIHSQAT